MNECLHITSLCENGECVNNDGSYRCKCKMGYQLDETGKKCVGEYKNRMQTVSDINVNINMFKNNQETNKYILTVENYSSNGIRFPRIIVIWRLIYLSADGYN